MFTMGSKKENDTLVLTITGEATIVNAKEMRETLIPLIEANDTIVLDTDGVTEADLSFLQFIDAAHKLLIRNGKHIGFYNERISPAVKNIAANSGYFTQHQCTACSNKCLMHDLIA